MIDCTFAHLPGIRRKGEIRLWHSHIISWRQMIAHSNPHPHFTKKVWARSRKEIIQCQQALEQKNFEFLASQIPEEFHWRMIPDLWKGEETKILFFDIEMSGLDLTNDYITSIATFDGQAPQYFVKNKNLDKFPRYLQKFSAICTFDGERADIPFLQQNFGNNMYIPPIHFDLFSLSRRLHMHGGLKEIEEKFNLSRYNLKGISGESAIYLWKKFQSTQHQKYLDTLLAYNLADVMFLPFLLQEFYNLLRREAQLPSKPMNYQISPFKLPLKPDLDVVKELKVLLEQAN